VELELVASGPGLGELAVSLGAEGGLDLEPAGWDEGPDGGRLPRPVAFRAYTAPAGGRFVLPEHFCWAEVDRLAASEGAALALPAGKLARALSLDGADAVGRDPEDARLFAVLRPGAVASVLVPEVDAAPGELLLLDVRALVPDDSAPVDVAAWLVAPGSTARVEDLERGRGALAFSGWKRPLPVGEITVGLPVPPLAHGGCALVAAARRAVGVGDGETARPAVVEWRAIRLGRPPRPLPTAAAVTPAVLAAPASSEAVPVREALAYPEVLLWDEVALLEVRRLPSGYQHLGLGLRNARFGTRRWPELRFKVARRGGRPALEFRPYPAEPAPFRAWPATERDDHGPYFRVPLHPAQAGELRQGMDLLGAEDRTLLAELVRALPATLRELEARGDAREPDLAAWVRLVANVERLLTTAGHAEAA
jgi:hypothetical protein